MAFWRKKKQAEAAGPIRGNDWEIYTYPYGEGFQAVIRVDAEFAQREEHRGHQQCCRLIVFISDQHLMESGLPVREEVTNLEQLDDAFIDALESNSVDGRLAGVMTYGGMRDLVFQLNSGTEEFEKCATTLMKGHPRYRFEIKKSDGWDFFDRKLRPTPEFWQQITDRKLIYHLTQGGADPNVPRKLDHTFLGPNEALDLIRQQLGSDGFEETGADDGRLVLSKPMVLDIDEVWGLTGRLVGYCAKIGVRYDGWGAAIEENMPNT